LAVLTARGPAAWSSLVAAVRSPLERSLAGDPVSVAEANRLIRATAAELPALMEAAATLRDRGKGRTVTYSRKVFIPLTNLCRDSCGYCTFAKGPRHPDARTMEPDDVLAVAEAGAARGCKEALFSLGERPEDRYASMRTILGRLGQPSTNAYLAAMCERVFRETGLVPHANCGVMTRDELLALRGVNGSMGLMLESVSDRLLERGQAHYNCVGKVPATRLETMATAGDLEIPFTTGILIGIGETPEERVASLFAIRELQARYGHIQEVIIQNFRVKPTIRMRRWPEPSVAEMLTTIAVARLILGPSMNVQAPPNLFLEDDDEIGDTTAMPATVDVSAYLDAGINDWGGVSPVTLDHINPERAWPAIPALRQITESTGSTLRERLCVYPEFLAQERFVRAGLRDHMAAWTDESGLVKEAATVWN
jgi:7,8-didemethyl-8-hydroxy-5-deazariboflavin synthase CofG subunit